jgi:hypothetical protein
MCRGTMPWYPVHRQKPGALVPQEVRQPHARFDAARDGSSVDRQLDRLFMHCLTATASWTAWIHARGPLQVGWYVVEPRHRGLADVFGHQLVDGVADDRLLGRGGAPGCGAQTQQPDDAADYPVLLIELHGDQCIGDREITVKAREFVHCEPRSTVPHRKSDAGQHFIHFIVVSHKPVKKSAAAISLSTRSSMP